MNLAKRLFARLMRGKSPQPDVFELRLRKVGAEAHAKEPRGAQRPPRPVFQRGIRSHA